MRERVNERQDGCSVIVGQHDGGGGGWRCGGVVRERRGAGPEPSVDTAVCARLLPRTSTSLPLRHLGPGPASVIRDSPASRRFRILNARRKMPGRPSDARDASPAPPPSLSSFSDPFFWFSSPLVHPDRSGYSRRRLSSRSYTVLAKYTRIFTRIMRHKYHSSAIPIGVQSIAIDLFVGIRLFSCPRLSVRSCASLVDRMRRGIFKGREKLWNFNLNYLDIFAIIQYALKKRCNSILCQISDILTHASSFICLFVLSGYYLQNFSNKFSGFIDLRWSFISRDTRSWLRFPTLVCSDSFQSLCRKTFVATRKNILYRIFVRFNRLIYYYRSYLFSRTFHTLSKYYRKYLYS